jgi:alpha-glucuronidase
MINAAMNINKVIIKNVNVSSDVNEFFKEFIKMIMISLINLFSEYNQITLSKIY